MADIDKGLARDFAALLDWAGGCLDLAREGRIASDLDECIAAVRTGRDVLMDAVTTASSAKGESDG